MGGVKNQERTAFLPCIKQLYILLQQKYTDFAPIEKPLSFLDLQGVLRGSGNVSVDHEKLTEYLKDKYEI